MGLPMIGGVDGISTSIMGTDFVRLGSGQSIMGALYKGILTTAILSIPALYLVTWWVLGDMDAPIGGGFTGECAFTGMDLFWSMMVGLAVTGLIVWITEYYTGTNYRPVKSIAKEIGRAHV